MKINRDELDIKLLKHLHDPSFLLDFTDNILKIEKVVGNYVNMAKIIKVVMRTMPIHYPYLNDNEIFHLTKALYHILNNNSLNPEKYFTEEEVKAYNNLILKEKKKKDTIILENVTQLSDNLWICPFYSYEKILEDFENGLYTYNPKTQRETIKRYKGKNSSIEDFNIDENKIFDIAELMKDRHYHTNAIRWNVRKETRQEKITYNKLKKQLIIKKDEFTNIDAIDGMHRMGGAIKAIQDKPELTDGLIILIHHTDEETAKEIIVQESRATPLDANWTAILSNKDINMEVTKEINEKTGRNALYHKFAINYREIEYDDKYTTFEIFAKGLEHYYDLGNKNFTEIEQIKDHLITCFNFIIDIVKDKENTLNKFCFLGYIALSKELYNSESLLFDLQQALNRIDFTQITMNSYRIHKKFIENVSKYFIGGMGENAL